MEILLLVILGFCIVYYMLLFTALMQEVIAWQGRGFFQTTDNTTAERMAHADKTSGS